MSSGVLKGGLYVPDFGENLLSIGQWTASTGGGCEVDFAKDAVWLTRNKVLQIRGAKVVNSLYHLNSNAELIEEDTALVSKPYTSLSIWHERHGHLNYTMLNKMRYTKSVTGFHVSPSCSAPSTLCTGCIFGKMLRASFPSGRTRGINNGDIIHSDVCGPMSNLRRPVPVTLSFLKMTLAAGPQFDSSNTNLWFLKPSTSSMNCSRLKLVSESRSFNPTMGESLLEANLKNGYDVQELSTTAVLLMLPNKMESLSEPTAPLFQLSVRSQMYGRKIELWSEAVASAVHVLNRTLSRTNNKTPYELWYGKKPNISYLRIFGTRAFVHIPDAFRCKLDAKAVECIMVGYYSRAKAYRLWNPATRRIFISRDAIFDETLSLSPVFVVEDPKQTEYHFDFPLTCGQQFPEVYS